MNPESRSGESAQGESSLAGELCKVTKSPGYVSTNTQNCFWQVPFVLSLERVHTLLEFI